MNEIYKKIFFKKFVKRFLLENHITKQYYRDYRKAHYNRIPLTETPNQKDVYCMIDDMTKTYFSNSMNHIEKIVGYYDFIHTWAENEKNRQFWLKYYHILQNMGQHYYQLEKFVVSKIQQL